MNSNLSTALLALLFTGAQAQSAQEITDYPEYAAGFSNLGLTWETAKVNTLDGYTMTVFHVTGSTTTGPFEITKNALILQHGMGGSGEGWLYQLINPKKAPMMQRFAEMGFDVWLANNAGTKYSQVHNTYTVDDQEFWDLPWNKFGQYDLPALTEYIQAKTGVQKVAMVGHSQGTTQTFAGMGIIPDWYDKNISVAALMGPCTCPNEKYFSDVYTEEIWSFLIENEIWAMAGPNWARHRAIIMESGPQALKDMIPTAEGLPNNPIAAIAAYAQTAMSHRFQEYTPDWFEYINEHGSYPKTKLMDFGLPQEMKVGMYVGLFDDTCPLTYSEQQRIQMGSTVAHHVVAPWQGHVPWGFVSSDWFMNDMSTLLQMNQPTDKVQFLA